MLPQPLAEARRSRPTTASWKTLCTRCRENAVAGVNSPSFASPISTGTRAARVLR